MKARLRNGFVVTGRLANIFVSRGLATPIGDESKESEPKKVAEEAKDEQPKRVRRTKAEIEADKKKGV